MSRPFHVTDAHRMGLRNGRLRGADLWAPFRGVRSLAPVDTLRELAAAYAAKMTVVQCFSHTTAAAIWGLPLPRAREREALVHVSTTSGHAPTGSNVRGHRVRRLDAVVRDGLSVTSPARTWLDLASLLTVPELVVVGDALLAASLCTPDELLSQVESNPGRRGLRSLKAALVLVREGVDSPMETLLRLLLIGNGLPEPIVNRRYWAPDGSYLGRVDLSYPQWRIAIEYEGDGHRTDIEQFNRDIRRRERFESADWSVVRVAREGVLRYPRETLGIIRRRILLRSGAVAPA